ncbi:MAG: DUF2281 domain-containing protein [Gammaproteobacteria bacterium]|nr:MULTISPECIES: hypothetical protein [unclassified Moraxella]NOX78988.1 DUF2281 domain-containing protein [Gammaproteobacteria bacterium]RVU81961.1 hypothetical protein EOL70_24380 [Leucothrix sargassi]VWX28903.1 conserved hypothetical protein [Moraxellaceae bacterium 17A]HCN15228.1 hypothetical protein [Moraxellaceae bacterium]NPA79159.1 DUF2281 domain-containing protein [Gammaproteobacteria bacterium]
MQITNPSPTIAQAVHQLQILPPASQQTALDFINFLVTQNLGKSSQPSEKPNANLGKWLAKAVLPSKMILR